MCLRNSDVTFDPGKDNSKRCTFGIHEVMASTRLSNTNRLCHAQDQLRSDPHHGEASNVPNTRVPSTALIRYLNDQIFIFGALVLQGGGVFQSNAGKIVMVKL